jgi:coenzyme F420 hydrogenase subunit beta
MKRTVIAEIVENDLCIGCGLCAALCPEEVFEMAWNQHGEYNPIEVTPCTAECGLCLSVCPFAEHKENEDTIGRLLYGSVLEIGHHPEAGYYLTTYVGYADEYRPTSASGGVATCLLERLLAEGVIDYAVCVAPTGDPERLFNFAVFDTPESVRTGAGSAYYPVEMSGVIRHILETPGRYEVTAFLASSRRSGWLSRRTQS